MIQIIKRLQKKKIGKYYNLLLFIKYTDDSFIKILFYRKFLSVYRIIVNKRNNSLISKW